jgi:hypothetical protein
MLMLLLAVPMIDENEYFGCDIIPAARARLHHFFDDSLTHFICIGLCGVAYDHRGYLVTGMVMSVRSWRRRLQSYIMNMLLLRADHKLFE